MATEMVKEATPTETMMSRGSNYATKQKRLEQDEKELEELLKQHMEDAKEEQEAEVEEPDSEGTDDTEVQTESDTKQEAEVVEEDEAQEDDSELSREEKSFKKRYGDLRRHMAEKEKEWKERYESLEARLEDSGSLTPPKSEDDIRAWADKNPDAAAIIEAIAERKAAEKFAKAERQLEELDNAKYEADRTKAENKIRSAHADFDELREADEFHDWVEAQPRWVRDALYENSDDADSVIRVIDLYKVDNNLTPSAKKEQAKEAAKTVKRKQATRTKVDEDGTGSMIKESQVAKMSDQEFDERYEEIQEAMRSGKFIYDISGKAR